MSQLQTAKVGYPRVEQEVTTIWKFPLKVTDIQTIIMPQGARMLAVQCQYSQPCIWALVNQDNPAVGRSIRIYGTGHPIPIVDQRYVGTFQMEGGTLVFHVFEVQE